MGAHLMPFLALLACVQFEGMPEMPVGSSSNVSVYSTEKEPFKAHVFDARYIVRHSNLSWTLVGTNGEELLDPAEIRKKYGGVIFVGDSQIREVAWSGLLMLTRGESLMYSKRDRVFGNSRSKGLARGACVPQSVGKTGFTAACGDASAADDGKPNCQLYSPFKNKTHAEQMRNLLLVSPHKWDGKLSISEHVCESDFFVTYQATWGAMPIDPSSLPSCLQTVSYSSAGKSSYMLQNRRTGSRKPVLWIMNGCGLHEMEFCDERRFSLPQNVLSRFSEDVVRGSVIWQTVGAGFTMKASNRFKGECAQVNAHQISSLEYAWLSSRGIRSYNYTQVALQYAPLMFDAIHFTYYWEPCTHTFPEMARLVTQLAFQQALEQPVEVCQHGLNPHTDSKSRLVLGQDEAAAQAAYNAAVRLQEKKEEREQKASQTAHSTFVRTTDTLPQQAHRISQQYAASKKGALQLEQQISLLLQKQREAIEASSSIQH